MPISRTAPLFLLPFLLLFVALVAPAADADRVPARALIGEDSVDVDVVPLPGVSGDAVGSGETGRAPFYPVSDTAAATFLLDADLGLDVRLAPLLFQLQSPASLLDAARAEESGLRNVDPVTGLPRLFDTSAACIDRTTDAGCLLPPRDDCDRAWLPSGDGIVPNPGYDLQCILEGYGDRAFERLCEFSGDFLGCALQISGSEEVSGGLSLSNVIGRLLGGDPTLNALLSVDTDLTCRVTPSTTCSQPANKGSKVFPFPLPIVQLSNDPGDEESFGCTDVNFPSANPALLIPCGGSVIPISYLAITLNPQQEGGIGCGPFWGTNCDTSGLDLRRADASVVFHSWPLHGIAEALALKASGMSPAGSEIIDPITGLPAPFRQPDEYRSDEGLQPGTLPWSAHGIGEPQCSVEHLGGGVFPFPPSVLNVPGGSGAQPPARDQILPGCHRKWVDAHNGYLNSFWGTALFQTDPTNGMPILDPITGLPLQLRDITGNVLIDTVEHSGDPDPLGIVQAGPLTFPDAVLLHGYAQGGATDLLFSPFRPAVGPGHPFAGRRAVPPSPAGPGRAALTVPFASELAGLSWNFLMLSVASSPEFINALETVGDLADPDRVVCGGGQTVCGASLEGGSIPTPISAVDPNNPNTAAANRRFVAQMLLAYCGSDYATGTCRVDGDTNPIIQLGQLYAAPVSVGGGGGIDPADPVATQAFLDTLQFAGANLVMAEDATADADELEVNPPVPGPDNVLQSQHCSFITPQYCNGVQEIASFSAVGRDFALPDVGPPTIARRYWLWETGAAHDVEQASGEFSGHLRALGFGPFVSDLDGGGASSWTPILLEEPRPEEIDLDQLRDGLVTRDGVAGLDWLDVALTAGLSYGNVVSGVGGWTDDGWRHATTAEICPLFQEFYLPNEPCPGLASAFSDPSELKARRLPPLLGQPGSPAVVGLFDDGEDMVVGLAEFRLISQAVPPVLWSVAEDAADPSVNDPAVGHFLVRPIPEPSAALLQGVALLVLAHRAGSRSRRRGRREGPR